MEQLICPGCNNPMTEVEDFDITSHKCLKCGGVFLDKGELNVLATGMSGDIEYCSIDEGKHPDKLKVRTCPRCPHLKMEKIALLVYTHLIFDYCKNCGSFYLDKGEVEEMNREMEECNKEKIAEEFRGTIGNHLVRLDKLNDVMLVAPGGVATGLATGFSTIPREVATLRISVFFDRPLSLGLRICSELWADKLMKIFGLFHKQDITIGNKKLDSSFIIQGNDSDKVKKLLSSSDIQAGILEFASRKMKIYSKHGKFEIIDRRLIYTEGPYSGNVKYDVKQDPVGVVNKMLKLASLMDDIEI